jgi:hypothetical protein
LEVSGERLSVLKTDLLGRTLVSWTGGMLYVNLVKLGNLPKREERGLLRTFLEL